MIVTQTGDEVEDRLVDVAPTQLFAELLDGFLAAVEGEIAERGSKNEDVSCPG